MPLPKKLLVLTLILLASCVPLRQAPVAVAVQAVMVEQAAPVSLRAFTWLKLEPLQEQAKAYQRLSFKIETDGRASNPFDPAEASLSLRLTSPSGASVTVPAFWYQAYDPQSLRPVGPPGWQARFTPDAPGAWTAAAELAGSPSAPALASQPVHFTVAANPQAHGFLRVSRADPRYFAFDDGTFFFPVGLDMAWSTGNVLRDYTTWLDRLSHNGGNIIRVWMASWSFSIEWKDTGLGNYTNRLKQAWLLDQVLDLAEQRGVYVILCLLNHGAFSQQVNPEWQDNPYNAALGGPLQDPADFATDPAARAYFKRRLRYIAARWAAYPNLGAWEWWNEADWTPIEPGGLLAWIREMSAELKQDDPYHHLVSTSFLSGADQEIWSEPELDFTQQHDYSASDPLVYMSLWRWQMQAAADSLKPALMAEYGSSAESEDQPYDRDGLHLHNGLWAAPFSGYAGTAMYWWWDNYVAPNDLWSQYQGIANFMKGENLQKMAPANVSTRPGGAAALLLESDAEALGWVRNSLYTIKDAQEDYDFMLKDGAGLDPGWCYRPPVLKNQSITVQGLPPGAYTLAFYSTLDGAALGDPLRVSAGSLGLTIQLPEFQSDLAFKVVKVP